MNLQVPLTNDTILVGKRASYLITGLLGRGGFGVTYRADTIAGHPGLPRQVAIKEFFPRDLCERDMETNELIISDVDKIEMVGKLRNRFVKESQNISSCDINTVIKVYETIECNGTAYMVMELFDGVTLKEMMDNRNDRPFSPADARRLVTKIADGLTYLHEKKINHLDIKPSNIMVSDDLSRLVLIDFGMSRQYNPDGSTDSEIIAAVSKGYAAPEQYAGVHRFSPESDIYSLGATFYKLLTGETPPDPFELEDGSARLSFPSDVPEAYRKTVKASMASDRRERLGTADQFKQMLEKIEFEAEDVRLEMPKSLGPKILGIFFNLLLLAMIGIAVFAAKVIVFDIPGERAYRFVFDHTIFEVSDAGFLACVGGGIIAAIIGLFRSKARVKLLWLVVSAAFIFSQIYFAI